MLILVRGLPGSGKSTFAEQIIASLKVIESADLPFKGISHYEADMYFEGREFDGALLREAHSWCRINTKLALQEGHVVIVANTFTTVKEMEPYFKIAEETDQYITVYECYGTFGSIHGVPDSTMAKMQERWQELPRHPRIVACNVVKDGILDPFNYLMADYMDELTKPEAL